jgi:surface protein
MKQKQHSKRFTFFISFLAMLLVSITGVSAYLIAETPSIDNIFTFLLPEILTGGSVLVSGPDFYPTIPSEATAISFTTIQAPTDASLTDVSEKQDGSIVSWYDDTNTTYYVSTQNEHFKIYSNQDSSYMFYSKVNLASFDFSNLDTHLATTMKEMFGTYYVDATVDVEDLGDKYKLTISIDSAGPYGKDAGFFNTYYMQYFKATSIDLSTFDTSNVTDFTNMFAGLNQVETLDLSSFSFKKAETLKGMFGGYEEGTALADLSASCIIGAAVEYNYAILLSDTNENSSDNFVLTEDNSGIYVDKNIFLEARMYYNIAFKDTYTISMHSVMSTLPQDVYSSDADYVAPDISLLKNVIWPQNLSTSTVKDFSYLFMDCIALENIDISNFDISNATSIGSMFRSCESLESINLSSLDTSNVQDMSYLFCDTSLQSIDISNWNMSNVLSMQGMFANCTLLQELNFGNEFLAKSVTDMSFMFCLTPYAANIDFSKFNTEKLEDISSMFYGTESLETVDLTGWYTPNLKNMHDMFGLCNKLKSVTFGDFCTTNVTDMSGVFQYAASLEYTDIANLDTSSVEDMSNMFALNVSYTQLNLSSWDTRNVKNMSMMFFADMSLTSLDISGWNTKNVENMSYFIYFTYKLTDINLSSLDMSSCTDLTAMLAVNPMKEIDISDWNLNNGKIRNVTQLFAGSSGLTTIYSEKDINTEYLTGTDVFTQCDSLQGAIKYNSSKTDSSYFNYAGYITSKEVTYSLLLAGPEFYKTIPDKADTVTFTNETAPTGVTTVDVSAAQDGSILGWISGSTYKIGPRNSNVKIQANPDCSKMFFTKTNISKINWGELDTSLVTDMSNMFATFTVTGTITCKYKGDTAPLALSLTSLKTEETYEYECNLVVDGLTQENNYPDTSAVFWPLRVDFSQIDTSHVTNFEGMFSGVNYPIDISAIDFSSATNMKGMFNGYYYMVSNNVVLNEVIVADYLTKIDANSVNFGDNISTTESQYYPQLLTVYEPYAWNNNEFTIEVAASSKFPVDVSDIEEYNTKTNQKTITFGDALSRTGNVTDMSYLFFDETALTDLDLNTLGLNTSSVTNMAGMFAYCEALTSLDVSSLDTSNVTSFDCLFVKCKKLTSLNVSNFNTNSAISMQRMFDRCSNLTEIDVSAFNTHNVKNMGCMFSGLSAIATLDVSNFDFTSCVQAFEFVSDCKLLTTIKLGELNTGNLKYAEWMFSNNDKLRTIYAKTELDTSSMLYGDSMFILVSQLNYGVAGKLRYDSDKSDYTYCTFDGYLTKY